MNKINIKGSRGAKNYICVTSQDNKCTCYVCAICIGCVIFPPAVAIALGSALSIELNSVQNTTPS